MIAVTIFLSLSAAILYLLSLKRKILFHAGTFFHIAANLLLWWHKGYPPFIGGYGSVLFFSLLLVIKLYFVEHDSLKKWVKNFVFVLIIVSLFIPGKHDPVEAVLATVWLGIHVPLFFLGYLSLTIAFFQEWIGGKKDVVNREMRWAFVFIYSGIFTGAIWAELAWGKFWGYDGKEVWALVTLIFTISYFVAKQASEKRFAVTASFLSMILTYLVVSFVIPGMHAYM